MASASLLAVPAAADTLPETFAKAYANSPTLNGARAQLRALDDNVPIARAGGLPTLRSTSGYTENVYNSSNSAATGKRQATAGVEAGLPLFMGGAVRNGIRAAETRVEGGRAALRGTEAEFFTQVVAAYMDVILADAVVQLNGQNVSALEYNLKANQSRYEAGDLSRTDMTQSQARLELAAGQLEQSRAKLIGARETFVQVVGSPPGTLEAPPALPALPASAADAVTTALKENPKLEAARKEGTASGYDVGVARAERLPKLSITAGVSYYNYLNSLGSVAPLVGVRNNGIAVTVGPQLSIPIFQGGRAAAIIRQAQERQSAAFEQTVLAEREVIAQARSAYATWEAAQLVIARTQKAVEANRLSVEGVRAENTAGSRTVLDILNAEQELLNSQVALVTARRDAYVSGFALLAAMGRAQAQNLGLPANAYDPAEHYQHVRHDVWDFGGGATPAVVASTTKDVPVQDAVQRTPLDQDLARPVPLPPGQQVPPATEPRP